MNINPNPNQSFAADDYYQQNPSDKKSGKSSIADCNNQLQKTRREVNQAAHTILSQMSKQERLPSDAEADTLHKQADAFLKPASSKKPEANYLTWLSNTIHAVLITPLQGLFNSIRNFLGY